MGWKNAQKNSVGKDWGKSPSLVEGIAAKITLPLPSAAASAWILDERGQRKAPLTLGNESGKTVLTIGPENKTIWYEIEVK